METTPVRRQEALAETLLKYLERGAHANVSRLLGRVRPEDVAVLLRGLDPEHRLAVFRILIADFPDAAGEVLTEMEPPQRLSLLENLQPEQIAAILERIPVDDAVFVLDSMPPALHEQLLELVDLRDLSDVQTQLAYPDSSAGRLMDTELFSLAETVTVREAIAAIQEKPDVEMIFYLYVVDRDRHLVGVTSLRQLLLSKPEQRLGEIMQREVIKARVDDDQEQVAHQAARYDLLAVPVVDDQNRLVGIVTVDDIIDVVKEEAAEDLLKMAGTSESELLYEGRTLAIARLRLPSLLVSLVGLVAAGLLLERFQLRFQEAMFLLVFVPVIMGISGSIGSQASAVALRGLASGKLGGAATGASILGFLGRQLKVAAVLGIVCGGLVGGAAVALKSHADLGIVVGVALFFAILVAALLGVVAPALLERFGLDPAIANGPLLTTVNDITGILIYFGLAATMVHRFVP
ncbi:MAG TPA: magnesium transporter [Thermoanaerobaculia bacterium]|nr:magnesium transporter [Thermoanaerobaculia bacterium]